VRNFLPFGDEVVQDFLAHLPQRFDDNNQIDDFIFELSKLNLELICLLTFDERLNSFSPEEYLEDSRSSRLLKAAEETNSYTMPTDQGFQLWRFFETSDYRKIRESQEYIEKVAIDLVEKKLQNFNAEGNSLLDQYLKDPNLEVKDLYGMASDMLLAGTHTSASTTSFLLNYVAHDERVQDLLHQEALRVLPNENDSLTTAVMNSEIPYTRAILKESFRLNPVSVGVGRITNREMVLSGYRVPKDVSFWLFPGK
jgi:ecdysteroid 22-hydroxylase